MRKKMIFVFKQLHQFLIKDIKKVFLLMKPTFEPFKEQTNFKI